jgi:NDP-sugar pyrophosphorylase family protein
LLPVLVLGGGRGTRMWPATASVPKPLLPVDGVPFAIRQLRDLADRGVTEVVYSIGYLGDQIRAALEPADLGLRVHFVDEGPDLLGTGGATRLAVDDGGLGDEFFLLYGDSFLPVDLAAVERAFVGAGPSAAALMTVHRNDGRWDTSNVVYDDGWVRRYDKHEPDPAGAGMRHIDYGLSVLRADTVRDHVAPGRPCDLAAMFQLLSERGRLAGYEVAERFYEIGSPAGLADLEARLRST